jgi:drug/metabolite transporter (DMT)-like permease
MNSNLISYFKLIMAMFIVGSSVVAGKAMVATLPVMLASCLRFAIAAPVLAFLLYCKKGALILPSRSHIFPLFLQSLTGVFLFSICLLYGLKNSSAMQAGLITGTLPAVTAFLAMIFLKEKLNRWQVLGMLFTISGVSMFNMVGKGYPAVTSSSVFGVSLIFAAVVCEALFVVIGKYSTEKLSALMIATAVSIFGFILFLPFAMWEAYYFDFSQTTIWDWSLVLYFALVVTAGAFWLFYSGLSKVSASVVGGFMAFIPISAMLLSFLFLGEPISAGHLMAGISVIIGIMLISINFHN